RPRQVITGHVGDSRAYLYRAGRFSQITVDHSYVQFLVSKGILTEEEARTHPYKSVITRALGMENVSADAYASTFEKGDMLLICSDGVTGHVEDGELQSALAAGGDLRPMAEGLLALALERGGSDNISLVLVRNDEEVGV
ncbi:MAG: serine/threonine-protein phosphatase, partial [Christensenellaceae bacterium]|nr:serine/threonine-protein phosphatase [Christensenellaceae bacterium]